MFIRPSSVFAYLFSGNIAEKKVQRHKQNRKNFMIVGQDLENLFELEMLFYFNNKQGQEKPKRKPATVTGIFDKLYYSVKLNDQVTERKVHIDQLQARPTQVSSQ